MVIGPILSARQLAAVTLASTPHEATNFRRADHERAQLAQILEFLNQPVFSAADPLLSDDTTAVKCYGSATRAGSNRLGDRNAATVVSIDLLLKGFAGGRNPNERALTLRGKIPAQAVVRTGGRRGRRSSAAPGAETSESSLQPKANPRRRWRRSLLGAWVTRRTANWNLWGFGFGTLR